MKINIKYFIIKIKMTQIKIVQLFLFILRCLYQLILQHQRKMEEQSFSKKKFKNNSLLPNRLVIHVMDYKFEDFRQFITFVHSGKVKIDMNNVIGECFFALLATIYFTGSKSSTSETFPHVFCLCNQLFI